MDEQQFDTIARQFATGMSRRRILSGLVVGLAGVVGLNRTAEAACRGAGRRCIGNGNCCTGICDPSTMTCVCPAGSVDCRGTCADSSAFLSDVNNCGACANRCQRSVCSVAVCNQGTCGLAADPSVVGSPCDDGNCCTTNDTCRADGTCQGDPKVCSRQPGACEEPGVCSPATCDCVYPFKPATAVCRAAAGDCDVAETCTGTSADCPPDAFAPASVVCRGAAGPCDAAEHCPGDGPNCPPDIFLPNTTTCRVADGPCDVAEHCPGDGPDCPPDSVQPSGFTCAEPSGPCEEAGVCDGSNKPCPANVFKSSSFVCRPAAGDCDVAEYCTGISAECPDDELVAADTFCRAAVGPCGVVEFCTGADPECPADAHVQDGLPGVCLNGQVCCGGECASMGTSAHCRFCGEVCSGNRSVCSPTLGCVACIIADDCDDGNPCTVDICTEAGVCMYEETIGSCTRDGEAGTCHGGECFLPLRGTCEIGATSCTLAGIEFCNQRDNCGCYQTYFQGTVCGNLEASFCSQCDQDDECPPGSFCAPPGPLCSCAGVPETFAICVVPCGP